MQTNEVRPLPYTIHKNQFKMNQRSKCKSKSVKLLGKKLSTSLYDLK